MSSSKVGLNTPWRGIPPGWRWLAWALAVAFIVGVFGYRDVRRGCGHMERRPLFQSTGIWARSTCCCGSSKCQSHLRHIGMALKMYAQNHGHYPLASGEDYLAALIAKGGECVLEPAMLRCPASQKLIPKPVSGYVVNPALAGADMGI